MSTQLARCIQRIIAVVTVLIGTIGVSSAIIASFAMNAAAESNGLRIQHDVTTVGLYGVLVWLVVIFWGVALWQVSAGLARFLVSEPEASSATESRPTSHRTGTP